MTVPSAILPEPQARAIARPTTDEQYRRFLEHCADAMLICCEGKIVFANAAAARLLGGRNRAQLQGRAFLDLAHADARVRLEQYFANAVHGEEPVPAIEITLQRLDARELIGELRAGALQFDGRAAIQVLVCDVTERAQSQRALQERERQLRLAVEAAEQGWWTWNIATGRVYLDRVASRSLGLSENEIEAGVEQIRDCVHRDDAARLFVHAQLSTLSKNEVWHDELRLAHPGARGPWLEMRGRVIERALDGTPQRMAGTLQNISERRDATGRIAALAQYDALTGLPNRILFRDRLSMAISRAKRNQALVGVVFLNLDRFARVNDTLGPAIGDRLLQEISLRLHENLREADTIGRLGGDEFTVIVEQAEEPLQLERVAEKIRAALSAPLIVDEEEIYLNASIGLSVYPRDSEDAEQLLNNADIAMYRAKSHGGNMHLFYSPEMASMSAQRLSMEAQLRRALDRNEFVLHYQPTFDARTCAIVGAEALVRWNSRNGLVLPAEFIPIAEETGLIFELGAWVMHTACAQSVRWQQQGLPPLRVAVNLSARQFTQTNLLDTISTVLSETRLPPEWLALEITESVLMHQHDFIADTLSRLSALGIRIAIDDFGTGYSSLAYLKRFRVQELKIDRSFVHGIPGDTDDVGIATAIVSMAKSLGLRLIAEGVETKAQLQFLRELGCDTIQGFLLGEPVPPDQFVARYMRPRGAAGSSTSAK